MQEVRSPLGRIRSSRNERRHLRNLDRLHRGPARPARGSGGEMSDERKEALVYSLIIALVILGTVKLLGVWAELARL